MQDDEFKEAKDIIELLKENLNNWRQIIMAQNAQNATMTSIEKGE